MRPEIANLVVDTIYKELQNYPNVYKYPSVIGVTKNLFFISHTELEKFVMFISSAYIYIIKFIFNGL